MTVNTPVLQAEGTVEIMFFDDKRRVISDKLHISSGNKQCKCEDLKDSLLSNRQRVCSNVFAALQSCCGGSKFSKKAADLSVLKRALNFWNFVVTKMVTRKTTCLVHPMTCPSPVKHGDLTFATKFIAVYSALEKKKAVVVLWPTRLAPSLMTYTNIWLYKCFKIGSTEGRDGWSENIQNGQKLWIW